MAQDGNIQLASTSPYLSGGEKQQALASEAKRNDELTRDAVKDKIIAARDKLKAIPDPKSAEVLALLDSLDGLISEINAGMPLGNVGAQLGNIQSKVNAEVEEANAEAIRNISDAIYLATQADPFVTNFAQQNHYDAVVLNRFNQLFGKELGHDEGMLHMVGGITKHATADEIEAMKHAKTKGDFAVHLSTVAGRMRLSELANYQEPMRQMKEAIAKERPDAAHFIAIFEKQVKAYNEAKARGETPMDRLVAVPAEMEGLKRGDYPKTPEGEKQFQADFIQRYDAYAQRRGAELKTQTAILPDAAKADLLEYAASKGISTDEAQNPNWRFQVKQQLDMNPTGYMKMREYRTMIENRQGDKVPLEARVGMQYQALNIVNGSYGTAQLYNDVLSTIHQNPAAEEHYYSLAPDARMKFISEQVLKGGKFAEGEWPAVRLYAGLIKTPEDAKEFQAIMARKDPVAASNFISAKIYPDRAADENAPAVVKAVDQTVALQGAMTLLYSADKTRFDLARMQQAAAGDGMKLFTDLRSATGPDNNARLDRFGEADILTYQIFAEGRALREKAKTDTAHAAELTANAQKLFDLSRELEAQNKTLPERVRTATKEQSQPGERLSTEVTIGIKDDLTQKMMNEARAKAEIISGHKVGEAATQPGKKAEVAPAAPTKLAELNLDLSGLNLGIAADAPTAVPANVSLAAQGVTGGQTPDAVSSQAVASAKPPAPAQTVRQG